MSATEKEPSVFQCPACGRQHRADLAALVGKPDARLRFACQGCQTPLLVSRQPDGLLRVTPGSVAPSAGPAAADAPAPKGKPPPAETRGAPKAGVSKLRGDSEARRRRDEERERVREEERAAAERREVKDPEFAVGSSVGRYRIEEAIGRGGTGTVYRAFDPTTNRTVALKVLLTGMSEAMRQRFLREIEVQANIRHPHIMPVFDRGELPDGRPYFTMELLYSPYSLTEIVERRERGTLGRNPSLAPLDDLQKLVADVLVPVAEGIHTANVENGVVHRDLKPDNVLVDSRTLRPYVIDFGICHDLAHEGRPAAGVVVATTAADAGIVGTPRFLAPEQTRGTVHTRTDVWGLGALLHFVLSGEPPIAPASDVARSEVQARIAALKQAREDALEAGSEKRVALCDEKLKRLQDSSLRTLDDLFKDARDGRYAPLPSDAPTALAAVARKAMAVEPSSRYANGRQLAGELSAWASGSRVRAVTEAGGAAAAADTAKRAARRLVLPTLLVVAAAGLGFLLGSKAGGGGLLRGSDDVGVLGEEIASFKEQLDALTVEAADVVGPEATRLQRVLEREAASIAARIAAQDAGPSRDALESQLAFQKRRIQRQRVRLTATGPATWVADIVVGSTVESHPFKPGDDNLLIPGDWSVVGTLATDVGPEEKVRVPLRLALRVRAEGASADREPPSATIDLPIAPEAIPAGMVLVMGDRVLTRQAPYAEPSLAPVDVRTFLLEREEVTNAEYAAFLMALPDAEANERVPSSGFVRDPDTGRMAVVRGAADVPVVGVRPKDARAYAVWRGKSDGKIYRLPTEAEWVLAAGGPMGWTLPNGRRGIATDGVFQPTLDAAGKHEQDAGPHGERGLMGNARELVEPSEAGVPSGAALTKGAGIGDTPADAVLYVMRVLPADQRHPMTGFRLARNL